MSTHITQPFPSSCHESSARQSLQDAASNPDAADRRSWSECLLHALAQAGAIGFVIPPDVLYLARDREDVR